MAVTNNAWKTIELTAAADAVEGRMFITTVDWNGNTTAGDDLIVKDSLGDVIVKIKAEGTNHLSHDVYKMVNGVVLDTLDSGTVVLNLR